VRGDTTNVLLRPRLGCVVLLSMDMLSLPFTGFRSGAPAPIQFSPEQKRIIEHIATTSCNAYVDAVAGSGKTTTVIGVAQAMPQCPLLLITYNAMLKKEVKAKMYKHGIAGRVTVHNYHSLAVHYYDQEAHTDERLEDVIHRDAVLNAAGQALPVTVLVVDEVQDMTLLYYRLLCKFVRDKGVLGDVRLLLLGDVNQAVYDFKGADARFLSLAPRCFSSLSRHPFAALTLRETYRCPQPVANFVNAVMLGEDRMHSAAAAVEQYRAGVEYVRYNSCIPGGGKGTERVVTYLVRLIREDGARPGDIFVLAPSVYNCHVASELENELCASLNVPTYVSTGEKANDEECMRGKLIITTYHRSKGLERPFVILLGFDLSYIMIYAKSETTQKHGHSSCPSVLYVAATRASRRLVVVEDMAYGPLPFLKLHPGHCDGDGDNDGNNNDERQDELTRICHTTMLCANDKPVRYLQYKAAVEGAPATCIQRLTDTTAGPVAAATDSRAPEVVVSYVCIPSQVVKYLNDHVYVNVERMLVPVATRGSVPGSTCVNLCHRAESTICNSAEDVSDLNGIAIPFMFEALRTQAQPGGAATTPRLLQSALSKLGTLQRNGKLKREIQAHLEHVSTACAYFAHAPPHAHVCSSSSDSSSSDNDSDSSGSSRRTSSMISTFLRLANVTHALDTRYVSQLRQVKSYTWLSASDVAQCHAHMASILPGADVCVDWEYHVHGSVRVGAVEYKCDGYIDAVCPQYLWEFKCVQNLTTEHVLQLCLYMWMWERLPQGSVMRGPRQGRLVNVRTGHMITLTDRRLTCAAAASAAAATGASATGACEETETVLESIVNYVLRVKFAATSVMDDMEFLRTLSNAR